MISSIWGDMELEANDQRPITFAQKLKQGHVKMSPDDLAAKAAKFETTDKIDHKEIISFFHKKFSNQNCIQQLMPLAALPGRRKWNVIFSKPSMVDRVINELIKFPSFSEDDPGIAFSPVRRRALLIKIPDASPDISDNEIGSALSRYGTVTRVWKQTWEGFPNIFNGKRLVTIFPSGGSELPPFIIFKNKKISLSYRGKPVFCNICMSDTYRTSDCPSRNVSHCYLCGSVDHSKKDCEKFVPFRRGRGRKYSGEIVELAEEEAMPISEDEPDSEEKHAAKPEPESEANETTDSPPIITADPENPSSSDHSTCKKPSTTIECVTTDEQNTDTKSNPLPAPKPKRITTKTNTPEEYAPFTRKSSKRPVPSTPEKNVVRKKPAGENS